MVNSKDEVDQRLIESLPKWARPHDVFSDDLEAIRQKVQDRMRAASGLRELGITKDTTAYRPPKPGKPGRTKTLFGLQHNALWSERPVVIGSLRELGEWNHDLCLKANEVLEDSGFWICQAELPVGRCYKWKWAMLKDNQVLWTEEFTRRSVVCYSPSLVTSKGFDELGEVTIKLDTLPLEDTEKGFHPWGYLHKLVGWLLRATAIEIKKTFL